MKCLNIRSTYAQIGQHTEQGRMEIHSELPQVYTGDSAPYKLEIHTTQLRIDFDLTNFWDLLVKCSGTHLVINKIQSLVKKLLKEHSGGRAKGVS